MSVSFLFVIYNSIKLQLKEKIEKKSKLIRHYLKEGEYHMFKMIHIMYLSAQQFLFLIFNDSVTQLLNNYKCMKKRTIIYIKIA